MASYHLTAKIGTKGKAAPHAAYISRTDKYSEGKRYEDIEATGYGNMPAWAVHNPSHFWQAADQHERANGSTYREIEIALPRELTKDQRLELVQDFINQEIGNKHAYQFAIHNPKATIDKGEQPHAHIMYSERIRDGIERNPEQYFKRYNAKNKEKGGAKKHSGGKREDELKAELIATRERWANIQNKHLKKHGHSEQVTHLSLEDQGINRAPEKHIGTRAYKMNTNEKAALIEHRLNAQELDKATKQLAGLDLTKAIRTEKWMKEQEEQQRKERERAYALIQTVREEAKKRAEESRLKQEQEQRERKERLERERIERRELRERMELEEREQQAILAKKEKERQAILAKEEEEKRRTPEEWEKMANDALVKVFVEVRNEWRKTENQRLLNEAETVRAQAWALKAEEPSTFGGLWVTKKHEAWEADLRQKLDQYHALKQQAQDTIDGKSPKEREQIRQIEDKAQAMFKEQNPKLAQVLIDKAAREQAEREEQRRIEREREKQKQLQKQAQKSKQKGKDWDMER